MILTFKVKHGRDFSIELKKARQIAEFALKTRTQSTKDVKQFGLKAVISNQILRKYSRNKRIKRVGSVKLTVPSYGQHVDENEIYVPSLKLHLPTTFKKGFTKLNQIELDETYAFISVTFPEPELMQVSNYIGVDRNATGHIAVVADPKSGKVWKLGKKAPHVRKKYRDMRRNLQRQGKCGLVKKIKDRESRITRDTNHKISKKIVDIAEKSNSGIKLEKLEGIRRNRKHGRKFNSALHSWSFYQLQTFIEYKAKLRGIPLVYVEPRNTSKECSRCGSVGTRDGKKFVCPNGHVEHADVNAGFNIALRPSVLDSPEKENQMKGSTDAPRGATP